MCRPSLLSSILLFMNEKPHQSAKAAGFCLIQALSVAEPIARHTEDKDKEFLFKNCSPLQYSFSGIEVIELKNIFSSKKTHKGMKKKILNQVYNG